MTITTEDKNLVLKFEELLNKYVDKRSMQLQVWNSKKKVNRDGFENEPNPFIPSFIYSTIIQDLANNAILNVKPSNSLTMEKQLEQLEKAIKNKLFELGIIKMDEKLYFRLIKSELAKYR